MFGHPLATLQPFSSPAFYLISYENKLSRKSSNVILGERGTTSQQVVECGTAGNKKTIRNSRGKCKGRR
jgi:hypothetical protein